MTIGNALNLLMRISGVSQKMMAKTLGISQASISNRLDGGMRVDNVVQMLDLMGYEMILQPKRGLRKEDQILILNKELEEAAERQAKYRLNRAERIARGLTDANEADDEDAINEDGEVNEDGEEELQG